MPHVPPAFKRSAFNCPHCDAYARMLWYPMGFRQGGAYTVAPVRAVLCTHCNKYSYWLDEPHPEGTEASEGAMVVPNAAVAPMPHPEMPANIKTDYEEARSVAALSPRGAAALLRLAIQKLCVHLGEQGQNINDDIAALVKKRLPIEIQQALDVVRVVGNHAVHPGELDVNDVAQVATSLFELVNHIVEDRISRPKKLKALYESLPGGARDQIKKRDA